MLPIKKKKRNKTIYPQISKQMLAIIVGGCPLLDLTLTNLLIHLLPQHPLVPSTHSTQVTCYFLQEVLPDAPTTTTTSSLLSSATAWTSAIIAQVTPWHPML